MPVLLLALGVSVGLGLHRESQGSQWGGAGEGGGR